MLNEAAEAVDDGSRPSRKRSSEDHHTEMPSKRRRNADGNIPLCDLSTEELVDKIGLFSGPQVIVRVEETDFKLPKALLCYHSSFFKVALNSDFKEGLEQKVTLDEYEASTFRLVVQWLYQGRITISTGDSLMALTAVVKQLYAKAYMISGDAYDAWLALVEDAQKRKALEETRCNEHIINSCTKFLSLAQYIGLLGSFEPVVNMVKDIFTLNPTYFNPDHIRLAMDLPAIHPIRCLFVQMAAKDYIEYLLGPPDGVFRYQKEIEDLEELEGDLMREFALSFKRKKNFTHGVPARNHGYNITDSSGEDEYKITSKYLFNGR